MSEFQDAVAHGSLGMSNMLAVSLTRASDVDMKSNREMDIATSHSCRCPSALVYQIKPGPRHSHHHHHHHDGARHAPRAWDTLYKRESVFVCESESLICQEPRQAARVTGKARKQRSRGTRPT